MRPGPLLAPVLALWALLLPGGGGATGGDAPTRIVPGRAVTAEISAGESHRYRLEAGGAGYLRAVVEQRDTDLVLELTGGGRPLNVDSPSGRRGRESALVAVEGPGAWTITVRAVAGGGAGRYRLEVEELPLEEGPPPAWLEAERAWTEASAAYLAGAAGEREEAADRLAAALPTFRRQADPRRAAEALVLLADLRQAAGQPDPAHQLLEQALPLWRAAGDPHGEARTLGASGYAAWRAGRVDEALGRYRRALALYQELGDPYGEAQTLNNMGHAHLYRGEARQARELFLQALEACRGAAAPHLEASLLNNLGGVHQVLGELVDALPCFERARALHRGLAQRLQEARALSNLGSIHRALGDYSRALEAYLEARELFVRLGDAGGEATALNSMGAAYLALGETERARGHFQQALPLRRAAGDGRGEAATLHNLGRVYQALGDPEAARGFFTQALALRRELDDPRGEATTLDHLGALQLATGHLVEAVSSFHHALELRRQVGDRGREARTLRQLGEAHTAAGRPEEARVLLAEALTLLGGPGTEMEQVATLHARARTSRALGRLPQAADHLEAALELLETGSPSLPDPDLEASFFAYHRPVYELAIEVAMERHRSDPAAGHHARALELSEQARGRGLLALLAEAGVEIHRGVDPELLARRRALAAALAGKAAARRRLQERPEAEEELARIEADLLDRLARLEAVEGEIRRQSPAYDEISRPRPPTAAELQRLVGGETLLLEYSLGEERSFLWAVSGDAVTAYELPPRRRVEEACRRLHAAWSHLDAGGTAVRGAAAELAGILLGPVAHRLQRQRLAVVPDGALHYLPFAALPRPGEAESGGGEPLLLHHEVVHLPSASVLALLRRERGKDRPPAGSLAVLADPAFAPAGPTSTITWPPLPWSRREAEAIAALAPAGTSLLALGPRASRELATSGRLAGFRLLHFATHGLLDSQHPRLSGLALATVDDEGRPREGFLGLQDVYNLHLRADLVVLSGCRTALGREIRGEGLVGLARGFLSAGASRVVASLWPVQDRATAELMTAFYRSLLRQGRSPAAALRSAQLEIRRELRWRDPYFWAGFLLVGEWR